MAEATRYLFDYKEIAADFVRKLDLKEGFWGICIEFGLGAQNLPTSPDGKTLIPASITFVQKIGIQRFAEANSLTVDAAEINPQPKPKGTTKQKAKK